MRILYVSTTDKAGGAEKAAYDLYKGVRQYGHESFLAVGRKTLDDPHIIEIQNNRYRNPWARIWRTFQDTAERNRLHRLARLAGWSANLGEIRRWREWQKGHEDFDYPGIHHLLERTQIQPDLIHLHNLHGGYFDLRALVNLSQRFPVFVTLHDEWSFTGHCAYTFGCERWQFGCGECPDLNSYPSIKQDGSNYNRALKAEIYKNSRFYIASPSRWLLNKAIQSILGPAMLGAKIIQYGVDLNIYQPANKLAVRKEMNLPLDAFIVLFIANKAKNNLFKDYATIENALHLINAELNGREIHFICIGEEGTNHKIGSITLNYMGYQRDPFLIAKHYQAANIFIHAAKTDNFPITILESLACGLPVVATSTGGIPEQILSGINGYLVPVGDSKALAAYVLKLLKDDKLRLLMANNAACNARQAYSLDKYINNNIDWYIEALNKNG